MIFDRNVRDALDTIAGEFEELESTIDDLHKKIHSAEKENVDLRTKVCDLNAKVAALEEALAEAHLTGES